MTAKLIPLAFDGQAPPSAWPSVSLCMIVKDEAANLAACLESVGDFAGEIIIVDTGSSDRTVEIAESFGAQVKHFAWVDDFAAARNESIKDARGEWIFWMDADDRLSPENLVRLKHAVASGQADAFLCRVLSRGGSLLVASHLRLFRNGLGLRFERPLHEDVTPQAARQGLRLARTNITVDHVGYAVSPEALQAKARRNRQIIERALAENPGDLFWRYQLGVTLSVLDDLPGCIEHCAAVIADPPDTLDRDIHLYQAYQALMLAYVNSGQHDAARRTIERASLEFADRQHFWIRAATLYLALDEPERAVEALKRAGRLATRPEPWGQAWAPGVLEENLIQAHLLLGDLPRARQAYLALLASTGKSTSPLPAPTWQAAQARFEAGDDAEVVALLRPAAHGEVRALRLLARAYARQRNWELAAQTLGQAIAWRGVEPESDWWSELARYTLQAGNRALHARRFCRHALRRASAAQSVAPLNLLGIIALGQDQPAQALTHFIEAILIDPAGADDSARHNLAQACRPLGLTPADAIRQYGLNAAGRDRYAEAALAFTAVIEMDGRDAEAHKLLAVALQRLGRLEEALQCWQAAQQLEAGVSRGASR